MAMIKKINKIINNPRKAWRYLSIAVSKRIGKKKGTLLMIGLDSNGELDILYPGYKMCYCFEANPERYSKLFDKYRQYENVRLFNVAVVDFDGEIEFNISNNNNGASSSIGDFNKDWLKTNNEENIVMINKIKVPCINLLNFLKTNKILFIDDYISDIQGMDLQVLKTLQPMIRNKQIGTIRCEVTKDKYKNIYHDLPDNSESGFMTLLHDNYQMIAKGWGILKDYKFDKIPEDVWEMDCKWELKK